MQSDEADDYLEPLNIDLGRLLADPDPTGTRPRRGEQPRNDSPPSLTLDDWLYAAAIDAVAHAARGTAISLEHAIRNTDRTVGARLAGELARRFGDTGLPSDTLHCTFHGSAGQSFGAFCLDGMHLVLWGDANDYVGKGMAGGEIVIRPPAGARYASHENFIVGNTVLYGATGGALFAAGRAGERFAVRNSGATAVVEGVGDHGCEYMTGGTVVILGPVGRNFAAGMTGGVAFVFDPHHRLAIRLNPELVKMEPVPGDDAQRLLGLVQRHARATGSAWAQQLLAQWSESLAHFVKVASPNPP